MLQQMRRVQSALEDERHRTDTASYTGTDQAKTVEVTLDWRHWLTGLNIEDGLLRLGAEEVAQRVNEALATHARPRQQPSKPSSSGSSRHLQTSSVSSGKDWD